MKFARLICTAIALTMITGWATWSYACDKDKASAASAKGTRVSAAYVSATKASGTCTADMAAHCTAEMAAACKAGMTSATAASAKGTKMNAVAASEEACCMGKTSASAASANGSCAMKGTSASAASANGSCPMMKGTSASAASANGSCAMKGTSASAASMSGSCPMMKGTSAAAASANGSCAMKGTSASAASTSGSCGMKSMSASAAGQCNGHGMGAMASASAHSDCEACIDGWDCNEALDAAGAHRQAVRLKNGVMYVYTADSQNQVSAVQAAVSRRGEHMTRLAAAGDRAHLCAECKSMRGAMASGKLTREVVNIEGGSLTLITSTDPTVVAKIHAMADTKVAARIKS